MGFGFNSHLYQYWLRLAWMCLVAPGCIRFMQLLNECYTCNPCQAKKDTTTVPWIYLIIILSGLSLSIRPLCVSMSFVMVGLGLVIGALVNHRGDEKPVSHSRTNSRLIITAG